MLSFRVVVWGRSGRDRGSHPSRQRTRERPTLAQPPEFPQGGGSGCRSRRGSHAGAGRGLPLWGDGERRSDDALQGARLGTARTSVSAVSASPGTVRSETPPEREPPARPYLPRSACLSGRSICHRPWDAPFVHHGVPFCDEPRVHTWLLSTLLIDTQKRIASMLPPTSHSSISQAEAERSYADLLVRLERTEETLAQAGIDVHAASRLITYRKSLSALENFDADAILSIEHRASLNCVLLEADQLARSVATLATEPTTEGWEAVAKRALRGPSTPPADGRHTPGRDAQFELLVGALSRRGGLDVSFAEPDIQVQLPDHGPLSIAAKRVTSAKQLARRVTVGASQVRKSGYLGVVAVDLAFFSSEILRAPNMGVAMERLRTENRAFTRRQLEELYKRLHGRRPLGLITFVGKMAQLGDVPQLATVTSVYAPSLIAPQDEREALLSSLIDALNYGCRRWLD